MPKATQQQSQVGDMWLGVKGSQGGDVMEATFKRIIAGHGGVCSLKELGMSKAWRSGNKGLGKLAKYVSSRSAFVVGPAKNTSAFQPVALKTTAPAAWAEMPAALPPQASPAPEPTTGLEAHTKDQRKASQRIKTMAEPVSASVARQEVLAFFKEFLGARASLECRLQELADTSAWKKHRGQLGKIKRFLAKEGTFTFDLRKGSQMYVRLRVPRTPSVQHSPWAAQLCAALGAVKPELEAVDAHHLPPKSANVQPTVRGDCKDATCFPTQEEALLQVEPRIDARLQEEPAGTTCLASLDIAPPAGTVLKVKPAELRWTHGCLQRLFTCGRSLASVAEDLRFGRCSAADLPVISIVFHEGKWYSRNNRRLWCFKEAGVAAVQAEVSEVDQHFRRGLNTATDGWSVGFFPAVVCCKCKKEFPNRAGLKAHYCPVVYNTSAVDWDDDSSDTEEASEEGSDEGAYGEDGLWHPDSYWESVRLDKADKQGRSELWRAAAAGNTALVRKFLALGAEVDKLDVEGVSPMLAAVRRGHFFAAEELMWAGADQKPWQFTKRKGKAWSRARAMRYDCLLAAVNSGQWLSEARLKVCTKPCKKSGGGKSGKKSSKKSGKKAGQKKK
eukprot:TRINITY_DN19807_c0_g2_i1.p1 TRINITY_DN19807_c0_g2~~TRINITY_DN19807_c0_g2_i1.p1  ORF type:complete len:615 (+),score=137.73 TRINITY_DN19807_c0_g2_i1:84-1928(+)